LQAGALLALLTLLCILYWPQVNEPVLRALFFLHGFGAGAMVLCFATCREWNRMANNGAASGLINMCVVGAGAVMQPLIGALLDSGWQGTLSGGARVYSAESFTVALSALVITVLFAVFCVFRIKETNCQQQVVH
jgi:MFS family permease